MLRPGLTLTLSAVLTTILVCSSACTSSNADHRTLAVNGAVHVYANDTPPATYPGSEFVEVLGPQDQVKVEEVKYKNGYMAVKVKLKDGRRGWVFSGESIELK
jgi:hypothetical protein